MPRKPRVDYIGAWHHVMNRARIGELAFQNDADRRLFMSLARQAFEKYGVEMHAYCLMGTHFHLVLRSDEGQLSLAMQWLSSNYTRQTNLIHGRDGQVFRGRFHSVPILDTDQLINAVNYVHRNPKDLAAVKALDAYDWSSLGAYLTKNHPHPALNMSRLPSFIRFDRPEHLEGLMKRAHRPRHAPIRGHEVTAQLGRVP